MALLLILAFFLSVPQAGAEPAAAQEKFGPRPQESPQAESYGLAMHGSPKYTKKDKHLSYANPKAPQGGTLKMAAIGSFDSINPFSIKGKPAQGLDLAYDRLMARVWDEPFTLYPLIAERVDVPKDRSAITFHLNPKAQFHDKSPIMADDVMFSFETLKKEGRPNLRKVYRLVSKVEKLDERTVRFTLGKGYDRETVMILAIMPVLSQKYWKGKSFDSATLKTPLLTGPYEIAEFSPGHRIVYKKVKDYWAKDLLTSVGHFNFDTIIYDYYRDDTVAFEAFKAGDLGLRRELNAGKWASAYNFPVPENSKVFFETIPHKGLDQTRSLMFNMRRPPFDDIRVRKALNLMFDFEWINQNIFHDQYKRINSYFPNADFSATGLPTPEELSLLTPYKDSLPPEIFTSPLPPQPDNKNPIKRRENMHEADRLLKESGWIVKDGQRMKNGKPFQFEILLDAPENEKIALHFKRNLEKIGIKTNLRVLDTASYRDRMNDYDFDMTLSYWLSTLSPGTEQILFWGCQAAKEPARMNYTGLCLPAVDALAKDIPKAETRQELVARMRALDRVLMFQSATIPLYYTDSQYVAYWAPLKHPAQTPLYGTVLETWWMEPPAP